MCNSDFNQTVVRMQATGSYLSLVVLVTLAVSFIATGEGYSVEHAGNCYWISDEATTFDAAKQKCLDRSSRVVQLTSQEVFDVVTLGLDKARQYWVGLIAKVNVTSLITEYYWDNNVMPSTTQWSKNEPNLSGDCVRLSRDSSSQSSKHLLADHGCQHVYYYICEREIHFGDYLFGNGQHKLIDGSNYCPIASYPAASRLACSGSCAQDFKCGNFHFNMSSKSCTLYAYSYSCDVTMPDTVAVTKLNRFCE